MNLNGKINKYKIELDCWGDLNWSALHWHSKSNLVNVGQGIPTFISTNTYEKQLILNLSKLRRRGPNQLNGTASKLIGSSR